MYVGKKYTATKTVHLETDYHCARCEYRCEVDVVGVGQGAGASPYFLDNGGAQVRAGDNAEKAAHANAELTLGLAPCPRCGNRNGVVKFWIVNVLGGAAMLAAFYGLGAFLDSTKHNASSGRVIMGAAGLFTFLFMGYMRWINLSTAPARVSFHDPDPEPDPKAKAKRNKTRPPESSAG